MKLKLILQAAPGFGTALSNSLCALRNGGEVRGEDRQLLRGMGPAQGSQGISSRVHVCPLLLHNTLQVLQTEKIDKDKANV